jgi:hypothetical protein
LCTPSKRLLVKENIKKPEFTPEEIVKVSSSFSHSNIKVHYAVPLTAIKPSST